MKIVIIIGTNQDFIKAFPVYTVLKDDATLSLIHTGEDTVTSYVAQLAFPKPDVQLKLVTQNEIGNLENNLYINNADLLQNLDNVINKLSNADSKQLGQLGEIRDRIHNELIKNPPDLVIIFGDTISTLAASLAARKSNTRTAYVESGFLVKDLMISENVNKILTDHIADYRFIASSDAICDLKGKNNVFLVGNTAIETQQKYIQQSLNTRYHESLGVSKYNYVLIVLHRPCIVDNLNRLKKIFDDLFEQCTKHSLVISMNPKTKKQLNKIGYLEKVIARERIILVDLPGYLEFTCLLANSNYVLTDSNNVQEESLALSKTCFMLPERPDDFCVKQIIKNRNIKYNSCQHLVMRNGHPADEIKHVIYSLFNKVFFPIGMDCRTADILKKSNLRKFSILTDYLNLSLKEICGLLTRDLWNMKDKVIESNNVDLPPFRLRGYGRKVFMHYPDKQRILNLALRTCNIIKSPYVTFINTIVITPTTNIDEYLYHYLSLKESLLALNPNSRFKLIIIHQPGTPVFLVHDHRFNIPELLIIDYDLDRIAATYNPPNLVSMCKKHIVDNILHIFVTKFMIVSDEWLKRGRTKDQILNPNVLDKKMDHFEKYYVPWMRNQSSRNFIVIILIDNDLHEKYVNRLSEIFQQYKNIAIVKYQYYTLSFNYFLHVDAIGLCPNFTFIRDNFLKQIVHDVRNSNTYSNSNLDYVITTRIDDDDILYDNFVLDVQSQCACMNSDFVVHGSRKGFILQENIIRRVSYTYPGIGFIAIGLSLLQRCRSNIKLNFNVFSFPHHNIEPSKLICNKRLFKSPYIDTNMKNFISEFDYGTIYNRNLSSSVYAFETLEISTKLRDDFKNNFSLDFPVSFSSPS